MLYTFPKGFKIGATGAGWQMEGEFGKKEGHEHFPHLMHANDKENWFMGLGPDVASDHYRRFKEDIPLFRKAGILQYRFNLDWTRFIDDFETATVNEEEAAHYSEYIDCLIENGIEPVLCLEHWELPAYLYKKYDGYASRHVVDLYVEYAKQAFKRYGDRVKMWFCFNEPIVIPQLCLLDGFWWPKLHEPQRAFTWMHHKVMATALTIRAFREMGMEGKIGTILNPSYVVPRDANDPGDAEAARVADAF